MAKRLICKRSFTAETNYGYKIYWDREWEEYVVYYYCFDERIESEENPDEDMSYHTTDFKDAHATAEHWLAGQWIKEMEAAVNG